VLHHGYEALIAGLGIIHHPAQHMQNVAALRIDDAAISVRRLMRAQPKAHPDWPGVVGAHAELVLGDNEVAVMLPEFEVLVRLLLGELQIETSREISEPF